MLGEGAVVVALLFEAFFVDETLVDVFDAVLLARGRGDLVARRRTLLPEGEDPVRQLGPPVRGAVYSPFSLRQIVEFVVLLPLNLVPGVGVLAFLLLTGYRAGPLHHWRFHQLLGLTRKERKAFVRRKRLSYTWFGTAALVLQLVPGLSMLFLLTTAAGSALWVDRLEQEAARSVDGPGTEPEYTDDPL